MTLRQLTWRSTLERNFWSLKSGNRQASSSASSSERPPARRWIAIGIAVGIGYDKLGIPKALQPQDAAFQRGMTHNQTRTLLEDPDVDTWDGHFGQLVDAVILVGDATQVSHNMALERVRDMIAARAP